MAYHPVNPPVGTDPDLAAWLMSELMRISAEIVAPKPEIVYHVVLNTAPARPIIGSLAFADGTNWNPGGGSGLYEYTGGGTNGWRKLATGTQY